MVFPGFCWLPLVFPWKPQGVSLHFPCDVFDRPPKSWPGLCPWFPIGSGRECIHCAILVKRRPGELVSASPSFYVAPAFWRVHRPHPPWQARRLQRHCKSRKLESFVRLKARQEAANFWNSNDGGKLQRIDWRNLWLCAEFSSLLQGRQPPDATPTRGDRVRRLKAQTGKSQEPVF